ncbi:non-ribosomal peptide synthetase [Streptomyces sp. NPDC032940]|uniref:non-ribosomal peptide synthetase n=1 Tax=Streptomyces sp. NPDC032940 TaxID=3155366 RepID=UPI0033F36B02
MSVDILEHCLGARTGRPAAADTPALADGARSLTYAELHRRVTDEAAALRRRGVGTGSLVPLPSTARSADTVVSLLSVLAAGAAFTPVLTGADGEPVVRDIVADPTAWPDHLPSPPDAAYVLPTSGSTGPVKRTVVAREGLRAVFGGLYTLLQDRIPPAAVWTQLHPLTFGYSICEILGSLTFGGTLTLVEREEPLTFAALRRTLSAGPGPHVVCLTPSELSVLLSAGDAPLPSHLLLSGEPVHRAPLRDVLSRPADAPVVVVNTYAATETSGQVTADLVTADRLDAVLAGNVGRPLPGTEVLLRGPDGLPVPPGDTRTEGEIEVRGPSVAAGYLDAAAHAAKFGADGPRRVFRTGDRGRWSGDGGLVVTGRAERRVKLGGSWTALDELERTLVDDGLAGEAVAAVEEYTVDGASGGRLLVAVTPVGATHRDTAARARERVLRLLPGPVTVRVVVCEDIPRTAHGKTDLAALSRTAPAPVHESGVAGTVARIWAELLGAGFSADANLFETGVDSLGVVAAASRLSTALGRPVSPTFVFDHPRIALQIAALSGREGETAPPPADTARKNSRSAAADRRREARLSGRTSAVSVPSEGVMQ